MHSVAPDIRSAVSRADINNTVGRTRRTLAMQSVALDISNAVRRIRHEQFMSVALDISNVVSRTRH